MFNIGVSGRVKALCWFAYDLPWWDDFIPLFDGTKITWQVQFANKAGTRFQENMFITRNDFAWVVEKAKATLEAYPDLRLRFMDDFGYHPLSPELAFLHQTWQGCQAGRSAVGVRSDGLVCACLSLGERFMEADLKKESLEEIWRSNRYFRAFRTKERALSGPCGSCEHGETCRAGCSAMALSGTGGLGHNPFCIRQLEREDIHEDLWGE